MAVYRDASNSPNFFTRRSMSTGLDKCASMPAARQTI